MSERRIGLVGAGIAGAIGLGAGSGAVAGGLVTSVDLPDDAAHSPGITDVGVLSPDLRAVGGQRASKVTTFTMRCAEGEAATDEGFPPGRFPARGGVTYAGSAPSDLPVVIGDPDGDAARGWKVLIVDDDPADGSRRWLACAPVEDAPWATGG